MSAGVLEAFAATPNSVRVEDDLAVRVHQRAALGCRPKREAGGRSIGRRAATDRADRGRKGATRTESHVTKDGRDT
jgi:hypothetical protein